MYNTLLYSTLLCKKIAGAHGGHKRFMLTKLGGGGKQNRSKKMFGCMGDVVRTSLPVLFESGGDSHLKYRVSELEKDSVVICCSYEQGHFTYLSWVINAVCPIVGVDVHCLVAQTHL